MIDEILNRWAAGEGAGMIAKDFGYSRPSVFRFIREAKAAGDPRAVSHADAEAGTEKWRRKFKRSGRGWVFQ